MNCTRVLLSIEQSLSEELVFSLLDQHPEIQIIGKTCNVLEAMAIIVQERPRVWINSWHDHPDYPSILSHVQSLAPNLIIVNLGPNQANYIQMPVNSWDELIQFTCRVSLSESTCV